MSSFLTGVETEEDFRNTLLDGSKYWYMAAPLDSVLTLLSQCYQQDNETSFTLKKKRVGR